MNASVVSPSAVLRDDVDVVWDYYDIPLEGLARLGGAPHLFSFWEERRVPDPDEPGEICLEGIYALYPVSDALAALIHERSEIFERWHQAYRADASAMDHHPALPADRARYEELDGLVKAGLEEARLAAAPVFKVGAFSRGQRAVPAGCSDWGSFTVGWSEVA